MLRKILPPVAVAAGAFFLLSNDPAAAEDIDGTDGDDILVGNDGASDDIEGLGGNDTVNGGDETDTAPGDFDGGGDEIDGGFGNDTLNGEGGDDSISGDDNHCHFGEDPGCGGNDTIDGGAGDDEITGDDNFCHFSENDAAVANDCAGDDTINGGAGNDDIAGDGVDCELESGETADCAGNDTINGGEGDDEIYGDGNECDNEAQFESAVALADTSGSAAAVAGASVGFTCGGDDTINGGAGDDEIYGDGNDCESDESDFATDDSCAGDDTISGGDGDDYIEGDGVECDIDFAQGDLAVTGCAGDDILDGGEGDDIIFGDNSDFEIIGGGEGFCGNGIPFPNGEAVAAAIADPTEFELCMPGGADTITGGNGDDSIIAGNGNDTASGGAGSDLVLGDNGILFFEFGLDIEEFLAELGEASADEILGALLELYFIDTILGGGDDDVSGNEGADVVMGEGGHDVVCGDSADPFVTGGGGSDVPCPVVEGTFDATSGSVTIDLGNGIRELDDEFLEVNEAGAANPWELVILVAPTKGTLTIVGDTVTYLVNPGATGTDFFEYAIRRKVIDCPGEITVTFTEGGAQTINLCELDILRAAAVVEVGGIDYVQSGSKRITLTLQTPPPPPPPPAPVPPAVAAQAAALPVTGGGDLGLALAGLGLVALGAAVTAESKRRSNQLEVRA